MISLFGEPVVVHSIKLYPVKMKRYTEFMLFSQIFKMKKNRIPDISIIKMSYLDFLVKYLPEHPEMCFMNPIDMFILALSMCMDEETIKRTQITADEKERIFLKIISKSEDEEPLFIGGQEFEDIRKTILEINGIDDVDYTLSEEVESALEEAREQQAQITKESPATLEDMIDCYHVVTGVGYDEISEMQIRKFFNNIRRIITIENYRIIKAAQMSGMVTFKEDIPHWLRKLEKPKAFSDVQTNLNEFEAKARKFAKT
jgi:copper chaperone CopZ